ncbi:hypothetical protein JTB14_020405 [Gonioctena quinquepunctata]|nr:hypothetical protein JTB14_020405 [Gonioctena quinquepunctata]
MKKYRSFHDNHDFSEGRESDYDSDWEYREREVWDNQEEQKTNSRSPDYRERERDRSSRHQRHRDRDRDRDHRSRLRSRSSGSRWERKSEDRKECGRDRYRDDDRDGDSRRSQSRGFIGAISGSEIIGYKSQPPNNTIMIRGLAQHISEYDIRQDIILCELMPKDIRLIRKKDTGSSRGFAFVEFATVDQAIRWMEIKQGVLILQDQYRAIMQYSIPKDMEASEKLPSDRASADWFCIKCGAQNFKRRDTCFKCHASRMESEEGGSGSDEICNYTTKTIMMRNLDALTAEDSVMTVLNTVIPDLVKSISAVCIGRDPQTSTSRGLCYLGTESTIDSLAIYGALNALKTPLSIDGKSVILSYCKYNMGNTKKAYSQVYHDAFPNAAVPSTYAMADVDCLAEYAARQYAKTPQEYMYYIEYYRNFFTQQISSGNSITLQENQMDAANAAAAVAQSAIQQLNASKSYYDPDMAMTIPTGTDGKKYPIPDVSRYAYDKSTGYQYCSHTGLYYDSNSTYYWNNQIQKWLYWDNDNQTYLLAPSYDATYSQTQVADAAGTPDMNKNKKPEGQDKVKVAKKIAKDMERWAKILNQKKENENMKTTADYISALSSASADVGFLVLEKKSVTLAPTPVPFFNQEVVEEVECAPSTSTPSSAPLVAAYGGESESSGDEEEDLLDFAKLICNLCKRQLGSVEALTKHVKLSTLHKQNMEVLKKKKLQKANDKIVYRDRAKERRMKYGDPDEPKPSKLKEKYLKSRDMELPATSASVTEPIGSENVGNRLLQKMGWTEGQGLGKLNQGRTTIIQAEQRSSTVGLGNKLPGFTALAGESYKDCVKKLMYARYQELTEKESSN